MSFFFGLFYVSCMSNAKITKEGGIVLVATVVDRLFFHLSMLCF